MNNEIRQFRAKHKYKQQMRVFNSFSELMEIQQKCWKQGLQVSISNAEPYRDFQNYEDNDRCVMMTVSHVLR